MNNQLLIFSISLYVVSLIAGLIIAITGKKLSRNFLYIFTIAHVTFAVALIMLSVLSNQNELSLWLILIYFCSGLILSGIAIRKIKNYPVKIYYLIFPLSIIIFIYSPTRFFKTLYTGQFNHLKSNAIELADNYFLVQQDIFSETDEGINYKIYRKKGIITETVATGITSPAEIKSAEVLLMEPGDTMIIRSYNTISGYNEFGVSLKLLNKNKITKQ